MSSYFESQNIRVLGCDVFISQKQMPSIEGVICGLNMVAIANRGAKVWPDCVLRAELTDVFQCRFTAATNVEQASIVALLSELTARGFEFVHVEKLLEISGKIAFSEIS